MSDVSTEVTYLQAMYGQYVVCRWRLRQPAVLVGRQPDDLEGDDSVQYIQVADPFMDTVAFRLDRTAEGWRMTAKGPGMLYKRQLFVPVERVDEGLLVPVSTSRDRMHQFMPVMPAWLTGQRVPFGTWRRQALIFHLTTSPEPLSTTH